MPVTRAGIAALEQMLAAHGGEQVIAIEATGSLHRAWAAELDRRHPGAMRLFAPSETKAARTQLGSGRFKTDDRDCAALTYLARQGAGRGHAEESAVEHTAGCGASPPRSGRGSEEVPSSGSTTSSTRLCPGCQRRRGHGRSLPIETPTGQAVLACAVAFAGRTPSIRSLIARAPGRLSTATADYWTAAGVTACHHHRMLRPERSDWAATWVATRSCRPTSPRSRTRSSQLLANTDGQVLTSLPGVAVNRAAAFAAHSLPITRFPDAEHLYSATGLAPAMYQSATLRRRGRISRQGLAEHRDALMGIAWGLSLLLALIRRTQRRASAPGAWRRSRPASRSHATPAG